MRDKNHEGTKGEDSHTSRLKTAHQLPVLRIQKIKTQKSAQDKIPAEAKLIAKQETKNIK
jgi:hypothetical protein